MKNTYTAPRITVVDMEVETQILAGSQTQVNIESGDEFSGVFYSSENIFVLDDEEEDQ